MRCGRGYGASGNGASCSGSVSAKARLLMLGTASQDKGSSEMGRRRRGSDWWRTGAERGSDRSAVVVGARVGACVSVCECSACVCASVRPGSGRRVGCSSRKNVRAKSEKKCSGGWCSAVVGAGLGVE